VGQVARAGIVFDAQQVPVIPPGSIAALGYRQTRRATFGKVYGIVKLEAGDAFTDRKGRISTGGNEGTEEGLLGSALSVTSCSQSS
jgi:hypothetical protein